MPRLVLHCPRRVHEPSSQDPRGPKASHELTGTRTRTRPARPIDTPRIRAWRCWLAEGARNAESWVARALLPPRYGSLPGALWRRPRGAPDPRLHSGVLPTPCDAFLAAQAKVALPPRVISALAADDPPQVPVPRTSFTRLARGPRRLAEVPPDSVCAFWHAYARSFWLRSFWLARYRDVLPTTINNDSKTQHR